MSGFFFVSGCCFGCAKPCLRPTTSLKRYSPNEIRDDEVRSFWFLGRAPLLRPRFTGTRRRRSLLLSFYASNSRANGSKLECQGSPVFFVNIAIRADRNTYSSHQFVVIFYAFEKYPALNNLLQARNNSCTIVFFAVLGFRFENTLYIWTI